MRRTRRIAVEPGQLEAAVLHAVEERAGKAQEQAREEEDDDREREARQRAQDREHDLPRHVQ